MLDWTHYMTSAVRKICEKYSYLRIVSIRFEDRLEYGIIRFFTRDVKLLTHFAHALRVRARAHCVLPPKPLLSICHLSIPSFASPSVGYPTKRISGSTCLPSLFPPPPPLSPRRSMTACIRPCYIMVKLRQT